ncbi:aspartate aminotransferase family protein [bacterium]|nr:aspartate aminotransferase family protein [bacterium]
MDAKEIRELHKKYLFPATINYYKESLPLARGKGSYLYDTAGREYLDFFGGILTVSLGHCDDEVNAKIKEQNDTLQHCSTLYPTAPIVALAKTLADIAPGELEKSFFTGSGTEADETAIMLAKVATGRNEVIACRHSYSGRTHLNQSMTAHAAWRTLPDQIPGIKHAVAPYCYRCPLKLTYPSCDLACAKDIQELIETTTTGKVAAFICEPIFGVGGFITPPKEYFKVAVDIVRKAGGLFIADEVQTGFGRTGDKWWGIEHWGVEPDIMTMAKGIANGIPMGATMATNEVAEKWVALTISTFGGNPVSSTAAKATIDAIDKRGLLKNARVQGDRLRARLEALKDRYPLVGDVRGMGLMQALELVEDRKTKVPAKTAIARLFEETRERGLPIGKGGLYGNTIRVTPALNVKAEEVDRACDILDKSFAAVTGRS